MAKLQIVKGATSVLVRIFILDSTSTTGAGKTGLTNTSFTGTKVYVARDDDGNAGGTAVSLTAATRGTWSSGGIVEKDAANMPGIYEFGLTNASLATGSRSCTYLFIGTGIVPLPLEIELTGTDNSDGVRFGMTALPNAVPGAAGGVFIAGTNAATTVTTALTTTFTGNLTGSVASVTAGVTVTTNNDKTGYSLTQSFPSNFSSLSITAAGLVSTTSNIRKNSAGRITFTMTSSTTHLPQTGLTVTGQVSIDGAGFATLTNAVSEISNGDYTVVTAAADTNGNVLMFRFTATNADDLNMMVITQP